MDLSKVLRKHGTGAFVGLLALTVGSGTMKATVLTATSPVAVSCNTATGPGAPGTIVIKPFPLLTGSATIAVTFVAPAGGLTVTAPGTTTLSLANQAAGLSYTINTAGGCVGNTTGA